jgi:uncharacterized protein YjlB
MGNLSLKAGVNREAIRLPHGGWCPNNRLLPLLIYRSAFEGSGEVLARTIEDTFDSHGWPPAWRYTIYDFPHYHSTSHEVIGVFSGSAKVRFGDEVGVDMELNTGDVVFIPAGVSHERLSSSADFRGVGAYPAGFEPDIQRKGQSDPDASRERIEDLPHPGLDPVSGAPWETPRA